MLDRVAIWISAACVVHCLASAVFVAALSVFGGLFLSPIVHEVGLVIAMLLGMVALGRGVIRHQYVMPFAVGSFGLGIMAGALMLPHDGSETLATIIGVSILALGHDLNFRAQHWLHWAR